MRRARGRAQRMSMRRARAWRGGASCDSEVEPDALSRFYIRFRCIAIAGLPGTTQCSGERGGPSLGVIRTWRRGCTPRRARIHDTHAACAAAAQRSSMCRLGTRRWRWILSPAHGCMCRAGCSVHYRGACESRRPPGCAAHMATGLPSLGRHGEELAEFECDVPRPMGLLVHIAHIARCA